jgi:hypothetical protein
MSGTFQGVGTLQFTPDNKNSYAYSGAISINNETKTFLEFTTDDYILLSKILLTGGFGYIDANKKIRLRVSFNDTVISYNSHMFNASSSFADLDPLLVTIPPFTKVTIDVTTDQTSAINYYVLFNAEVKNSGGVRGNLDE